MRDRTKSWKGVETKEQLDAFDRPISRLTSEADDERLYLTWDYCAGDAPIRLRDQNQSSPRLICPGFGSQFGFTLRTKAGMSISEPMSGDKLRTALRLSLQWHNSTWPIGFFVGPNKTCPLKTRLKSWQFPACSFHTCIWIWVSRSEFPFPPTANTKLGADCNHDHEAANLLSDSLAVVCNWGQIIGPDWRLFAGKGVTQANKATHLVEERNFSSQRKQTIFLSWNPVSFVLWFSSILAKSFHLRTKFSLAARLALKFFDTLQ